MASEMGDALPYESINCPLLTPLADFCHNLSSLRARSSTPEVLSSSSGEDAGAGQRAVVTVCRAGIASLETIHGPRRELDRRKPMLLLRLPGLLLLRLADRRFCALLFQSPPRLTRFVPHRPVAPIDFQITS